MYKVLLAFADLEDGNYIYRAGDIYPRKGVSPSEERIAELASSENKQNRPLIEKVSEVKEEEVKPVIEEPVVDEIIEEPVIEQEEVVEETKEEKKPKKKASKKKE